MSEDKPFWIKYTGPIGAGDVLLWGIAPFTDRLIDGRKILRKMELDKTHKGCIEVLGPGLGGGHTVMAYVPVDLCSYVSSNGEAWDLTDDEIKRLALKMWLKSHAEIQIIEE